MADRVWSEKQAAIFAAVADEAEPRNLVVVARAGSGKTTTSIQALRCLDREKRAKVLTCAFNKEIQEELNRRVPSGVDARTFHSLGLSSVTKAFGRQFVNADHDLEWSPRSWSMTDRNLVKRIISAAKNFWLHTPEEITWFMCSKDEFSVSRSTEEVVEQVIYGLERSRTPNGEISFDDMVWLPAELGLPMPKYDWVSVDETQDLNGPQLWMARACAGTTGRIMAVGDDRQAIYGFRGADADAMGRMVKALNAKVLPLNITYRCARKIAALAQEIVPDLECAPDAPEGVVEWISEARAHTMVRPGDFILSRTNAPLMRWCLSLLRENIPARIRGRDVGKNLQNILVRSGCQTVEDFVAWLASYREVELRKLNRAGAGEGAIQSMYDKIDTLEALSEGLSTVDEMQRRVLTLFDDTNNGGYVMCSTVHKSKGLEADRVFLIESSFFGKGGEEDNIRYVAITRAKKELYLVS